MSEITPGEKFGKLTVIEETEQRNKRGAPLWRCECNCGAFKDYPADWLLRGRVTSCGCSQFTKPVDLTGRRFGHVVAVSPTKRRISGSVVWMCRCDCGNITYRTHRSLRISGQNTNCGCRLRGLGKKVQKTLNFVDDTCIERIKSKNLSSNNKSGIRGVSFNAKSQKWRASIGFKGKVIYLGQYETLESAAKARANAEEKIYEPFLEAYYAKDQERNLANA